MKYKVVSDGVLFYVAKKVWWRWVIVSYPYHYTAEAQERVDELNAALCPFCQEELCETCGNCHMCNALDEIDKYDVKATSN